MMLRRLPFALAVLALTAAAGIACGGSDSITSPTASPEASGTGAPVLAETPWTRELANVADDGTRSLESSLKLFTIAFGPLPGVEAPPTEPSVVRSGTIALLAVRGYWGQLTPDQQAAVTAIVEPQPGDIIDVLPEDVSLQPGVSGIIPVGLRAAAAVPAATPVSTPWQLDELKARFKAFLIEYEPEISSRLGGAKLPGPVTLSFDNNQVYAATGGPADASSGPHYNLKTGKMDGCSVRLYPQALKDLYKGSVANTAAHELFHCFQHAGTGLPDGWWEGHDWWVEGGAEWVGNDIAGPEGPNGIDGFFDQWLRSSARTLFARNYDAVGFFGHLAETGTDPWSIFPAMFANVQNDAAYLATGAENDRFLDSWGSGLVLKSSRGSYWFTDSPGITKSGATAIPLHVTKGVNPVQVKPYTTLVYGLLPDTDIVRISITGHARFSDGNADTSTLSDAIFCINQNGCRACPDGSQLDVPPSQTGDKNLLLGLTGGRAGLHGTVTGESIDDLCKERKKNAVAVHFDRPESRYNQCESQAAQGDPCQHFDLENSSTTTSHAGQTMELVSCDGVFGTWKGVMREGGFTQVKDATGLTYYEVALSDFPVAFTVGGDGASRQVHSTSTGSYIVTVSPPGGAPPGPAYPTTFTIDATVSASTMTIIATDALGYSNPFYDQFKDMTIEPAPAGSCP
jgi:hypothetical protein